MFFVCVVFSAFVRLCGNPVTYYPHNLQTLVRDGHEPCPIGLVTYVHLNANLCVKLVVAVFNLVKLAF